MFVSSHPGQQTEFNPIYLLWLHWAASKMNVGKHSGRKELIKDNFAANKYQCWWGRICAGHWGSCMDDFISSVLW